MNDQIKELIAHLREMEARIHAMLDRSDEWLTKADIYAKTDPEQVAFEECARQREEEEVQNAN